MSPWISEQLTRVRIDDLQRTACMERRALELEGRTASRGRKGARRGVHRRVTGIAS
jgi:hypothetical protein